MKPHFLFVLIISLMSSAQANSNNSGVIKGKVLAASCCDRFNTPVIITIQSVNNPVFIVDQMADISGSFHFQGLPDGQYIVKVAAGPNKPSTNRSNAQVAQFIVSLVGHAEVNLGVIKMGNENLDLSSGQNQQINNYTEANFNNVFQQKPRLLSQIK